MPVQLRFKQGDNLPQLVYLFKQAYDAGERSIEVACEDPKLPDLICRQAHLQRGEKRVACSLGGKVLDLIADSGLPVGTLKTRYMRGYARGEHYSASVVYNPVR